MNWGSDWEAICVPCAKGRQEHLATRDPLTLAQAAVIRDQLDSEDDIPDRPCGCDECVPCDNAAKHHDAGREAERARIVAIIDSHIRDWSGCCKNCEHSKHALKELRRAIYREGEDCDRTVTSSATTPNGDTYWADRGRDMAGDE